MNTTSATKERYSITVEAAGVDGLPAVVRLRGLLKSMLRTHGLKCVTCQPEQVANGQAADVQEEGTA